MMMTHHGNPRENTKANLFNRNQRLRKGYSSKGPHAKSMSRGLKSSKHLGIRKQIWDPHRENDQNIETCQTFL